MPSANGSECGMSSSLKLIEIDYIRRREAQERAAAKRAETVAAKRAHQELAQLYARLTEF